MQIIGRLQLATVAKQYGPAVKAKMDEAQKALVDTDNLPENVQQAMKVVMDFNSRVDAKVSWKEWMVAIMNELLELPASSAKSKTFCNFVPVQGGRSDEKCLDTYLKTQPERELGIFNIRHGRLNFCFQVTDLVEHLASGLFKAQKLRKVQEVDRFKSLSPEDIDKHLGDTNALVVDLVEAAGYERTGDVVVRSDVVRLQKWFVLHQNFKTFHQELCGESNNQACAVWETLKSGQSKDFLATLRPSDPESIAEYKQHTNVFKRAGTYVLNKFNFMMDLVSIKFLTDILGGVVCLLSRVYRFWNLLSSGKVIGDIAKKVFAQFVVGTFVSNLWSIMIKFGFGHVSTWSGKFVQSVTGMFTNILGVLPAAGGAAITTVVQAVVDRAIVTLEVLAPWSLTALVATAAGAVVVGTVTGVLPGAIALTCITSSAAFLGP